MFFVAENVAWALPTMAGSLKMTWLNRGHSPRYIVAMKCGRFRATALKRGCGGKTPRSGKYSASLSKIVAHKQAA